MTRRDAHPRRWLTLAPAVALVAATAACGDDDLDLPDPPAAPPTAATATPTVDPELQPFVESYEEALSAVVVAHEAGDPEHPDLLANFLDPSGALNNLQNTIRRNEDHDVYYKGELVIISAEVAELDPPDLPTEATIDFCIDYSGYDLVNREDDSPAGDGDPLGRYPVTALFLLGTDDNWYVVGQSTDWDEEC
ncbi:hypothetical protein JQS43_05190 [Natronosporangium hydrolyticum]|uniref:Nuclear transport factor 2 family protein n=1 Tax=Natronosporangium hydrolyticum TaxID=2811111 RepID=A0A895YM20_9ACTN|nr:hypothetical protein [Natronosporangium hydrolyticum]QSB15736.1 hypothetical protein JQS43_05190 [Natronosporangium hydrolyticum]